MRSLLLWDKLKSHLVERVRQRLQPNNINIAVIHGGLTSILQPHDVSLNKPFKDRLRALWNEWTISGDHQVTRDGKLKVPSLTTVCQSILQAWKDLKPEIIIKSFKKCCISEAMDGSEDDVLYGNFR